MIVIDASAVINALTSREGPGKAARNRLGPEELAAPALLDWIERGALTSASIEIVWKRRRRWAAPLGAGSPARMKTSSCPLHPDAVFLGEDPQL